MELQLALALSLHNHGIPAQAPGDCFEPIKRKRGFEDPCPRNEQPQTLALLSWNDKPNGEEDDRDHPGGGTHFCTIQKKDEENNRVVGWPPIESWRKKAFHLRHPQAGQPQMVENRRPVAADHTNQNDDGPNSFFVKVKMEGVAIARKLDLWLYHSHHSLKTALIAMFATYQAVDKNRWDFTLIYEDKDGDWLLAEDLPWNSFVESVRRLKILVRKRNKE